jgi:threonine dehydrogenase-like Zn-dependent dehydrogenase
MTDMNAVVGDGRSARLTAVPIPTREPGWLRLRVLLAGICRTDVYAASGELPLARPTVLGHELVAEVVDADAGSRLSRGDRVTASPLLGCHDCLPCSRGGGCAHPRMLGVDRDGAFAEEVVVPEASAFPVPRDLPLRRAAYVEPIAAALAVTRAPIRANQRGIVVGSGRIADLTRRVLRDRGHALDAVPDRASLDFVVETSGTDQALAGALDLLAPGGVLVLKSRPPRPLAFDVGRAVKLDITVSCVSYGPFEEALRLAGELAVDDLLGDVYPLDRFEAAMVRTREDPLGPKLFLAPGERG